MTIKQKTTNSTFSPKLRNYSALQQLGWMEADYRGLVECSRQLFSGNLNVNAEEITRLKLAIKKSLVELEDDIIKIRAYVAEYPDKE